MILQLRPCSGTDDVATFWSYMVKTTVGVDGTHPWLVVECIQVLLTDDRGNPSREDLAVLNCLMGLLWVGVDNREEKRIVGGWWRRRTLGHLDQMRSLRSEWRRCSTATVDRVKASSWCRTDVTLYMQGYNAVYCSGDRAGAGWHETNIHWKPAAKELRREHLIRERKRPSFAMAGH